ncbi:MAG: HlyD family type I secretion periplasmic adaptor subunit [Alphaproteobacteria bacterium]|nr:HlyD family type I secretion periplasmic adaptor subunit [Alphaproteobacteria bacterium SS10]
MDAKPSDLEAKQPAIESGRDLPHIIDRALAETKPAVAVNLLLLAIFAFFVWVVIWAGTTEVDEVTRGSGQVIPSSEVQVVQSLEGGLLAQLLVQEGDLVQAGQVLARIDDVAFSAEQRGSEAEIAGLDTAIARLTAEATGLELSFPDELSANRPEFVAAERALFDERQAQLGKALAVLKDEEQQTNFNISEMQAKIGQLSTNTGLVRQELNITAELVADGVVAAVEEIRLRQKLTETAGELRQAREAIQGLEASLSGNRNRQAELESSFRATAQENLNARQVERAAMIERQVSADDRVRRTELRAPVAGEIKSVAVKTEGAVLRSATDFIEIVPQEDDLKIAARIRPADIAFLHPGQDVRVKITAYDFTIYGSLPARLERIGADTVLGDDNERYYEIEVRTDRNYLDGRTAGEQLPIRPGMVAEVEILTGKRTILDYLLKPLTRIKERALTEA